MPRARTSSPTSVLPALALAVFLAPTLPGCASSASPNPPRASARASARAASEILVLPAWALPVWPSTTLLIPLTGVPSSVPIPRDPAGQTLSASVWLLEARTLGVGWNGPDTRWSAVRLDADGRIDPGRTGAMPPGSLPVLAIDLPADFHAEEIVLASRRIPLWPAPDLSEAAWRSPFPAFADWPPLLDAARTDETSPLLRWRGRLLRAGVPEDPSRPPPQIEPGPLEALAVQEELRWRAALSRLAAIDPELAGRLRAALLPTVRDEASGLVVPLWTHAARPLEQLLDILLDQRLPNTQVAARVGSWIERQARQIAWLERAFAQPLGPAGSSALAQSGGLGVIRAWVGNTSATPALAWLEVRTPRPAGIAMPEPLLLQPGALAVLEAPVRLGPTPQTVDVRIHVADRVSRQSVVVGALPAAPPGVALSPLLPRLTAADVSGDAAETPARMGGVAALLRRIDETGLAPGPVVARARWSILVDVADALPADARIGLIFAHEGGRTRLDLDQAGRIGVLAPPGLPTAGYSGVAPVARRPGAWSVEVPVPDWCVGLDDRLELGLLVDTGPAGLWSWPSRLAAGREDNLGLAVIDLRAWNEGAALGSIDDAPGRPPR